MASTNKTANIGLNQWVKTDPVLMDDMNADNQKLDAAIGALQSSGVKFAMGSYTGTGTSGSGSARTLTFGFKPQLVLVFGPSGSYGLAIFTPNCTTGAPGMMGETGWSLDCSFSDTGMTFYYSAISSSYANRAMNTADCVYQYIAIG